MQKIIDYNTKRNNEVLKLVNDIYLCPIFDESNVGVSNYTKLPLSRLAAFGTAFQPFAAEIQTAISSVGGSGLYYVKTDGKTMFQMKGTSNFIGSLKTPSGTVGGGQAKMIQLTYDPAVLFMAAAFANIQKSLDDIKKMQQEMIEFLIQKEKSELKGSLTFLFDVFNNYKFNWNNKMYKNGNHIKVLDIRQMAESKIVFYREQIISKVNQKSLLHSDQSVKKQLKTVQDQFKDYQLALYLLAFSSFLEVVLLENYNTDYLTGVSTKLENYPIEYRELYTRCYEEIMGYSLTSVQSVLLKGLSKTSTVVGKFVEKIPLVSNTQADETLIAVGNTISDYKNQKAKKTMLNLIEEQSNYVRPFVENINTINELYNKPVQLLVDYDNLYIATID